MKRMSQKAQEARKDMLSLFASLGSFEVAYAEMQRTLDQALVCMRNDSITVDEMMQVYTLISHLKIEALSATNDTIDNITHQAAKERERLLNLWRAQQAKLRAGC